ncbi:LysR family transcriptional regulator substrate-binding protein [Methylocella sp.]|uniref:LysR family transcriptional regulator substrate-binding protein n=1 Tax=Methylocella sp. TaxID=1978226 RepID=UPI0037838158
MQARGEEGNLRIGVHAITAGSFLDRLLEQFHDKNPGVRLHISEGTARDAQFMVREGQLDVAFMACTHEIPDLNSRAIWRDRLMVAPPSRWRSALRSLTTKFSSWDRKRNCYAP